MEGSGYRQPVTFGFKDDAPEGFVVEPDGSFTYRHDEVMVFRRTGDSPWIEIQVPDGSIAVWAKTGAVHAVDEHNAVVDPPITLPAAPEQIC